MKKRPILTYHRMIEAFNFVAAKETYLTDPRFSEKTNKVGKNCQRKRLCVFSNLDLLLDKRSGLSPVSAT